MIKHLLTLALTAGITAPVLAGNEPEKIDFDIDSGKVVPTEDFMVMVSVLGTALGSGDRNMPVTLQLNVGDTTINPWGDYTDREKSDVNDPHAPTRNYIVNKQFEVGEDSDPADTTVTVKARSWSFSGDKVHMEADTAKNTQQVKVLRDGDPVPDIEGYGDQADAAAFLKPYIDFDTNRITLDENQPIYLFELYTTNMSSATADFQDLVVLVTFGKTKRDFFKYTARESLYD